MNTRRKIMKVTKRRNEQRYQILDLIYSKGPISRVDISRQTGITAAITSDIVNELIVGNIIQEIGETTPSTAGSGRKRILLSPRADQTYYLGSELSEKFFSFCLTDNLGSVIQKQLFTFNSPDLNNSITIENYRKKLGSFINDCKSYKPRALGISIPGHFDWNTNKIASNNPLWTEFDLNSLLKDLKIPVFIENNVHTMAGAERLLPNNSQDQNYIFFHVSRGIFASYVYQGKVYGTNDFLVGEIGHMIVNPEGEFCECGRRGCLQTYASEAWIIKKAQILYRNNPTTYLHQLVSDPESITIDEILKAYSMGDDGSISILTNAMKYLAIALNNLAVMIVANKIILHGQMFDLKPLRKILDRFLVQNQFKINGVDTQPIVVKPYNPLDGAVAGAMLAVQNDYFNYDISSEK